MAQKIALHCMLLHGPCWRPNQLKIFLYAEKNQPISKDNIGLMWKEEHEIVESTNSNWLFVSISLYVSLSLPASFAHGSSFYTPTIKFVSNCATRYIAEVGCSQIASATEFALHVAR